MKTPKKEVEPIAPNSEAESQTKYATYMGIPIQVKNKINEEEAIPPPTKPGSVHRRVPADQAIPPQHLGAVRGQKKIIIIIITTHVMQDSTLCPRQYLHAPLLCRGALCRVSHQPGKYGIKNKQTKNKKKKHIRFNSRQAVRSNSFMGKKPQVEVTQGSRLWLTSTLKPLDLPRVIC